jgi:NAD(P)-dependent dehydrogenase (short-subunit alcohol dehydrogenase family)
MSDTKIAVITGANGGLGKALVKEFAREGWQVVGTGRSEQPVDLPENATYRQFDASSVADSESFWRQLKSEHPDARICLVNNAGGYVSGGLIETTSEDYELQIRSSFFSSVFMTRGLALVFQKARIINVVSSSALRAHKNNSAYGAAKAAQMHFFQSLQDEFKPEQYQITNLYPYNISSEGPSEGAMTAEDLAAFVREQAENDRTYYLRDVTVWPR